MNRAYQPCDLPAACFQLAIRKTLLALFLFISIFLNTAGEGTAQKRAARRQSSPAGVSVIEEAQRQANAFWNARATKCGEDHYSRLPNGNIIQYKGVTIRVLPSHLSEADILNGYQFRGTVAFDYRLSREYSVQRKQWSEWSTEGAGSFFYKNSITKRSSQWNIEEAGNYTTSVSKKAIVCSDLNDPTASARQYFERKQQQVQDAELAAFLQNRNQRGFISTNLTDEAWRYLGSIGKNYWIYRASIFSKEQYLFARGEPSQIVYKNLPEEVIKLIGEGYDPSSLVFAPNGGWVIFKKEYAVNYFSSIRVAAWNNISDGLARGLQQAVNENQNIEFLRFTPDGKAIIIIRDYNSGGEIWNYRTYLPESHPLRAFLNGLKDFDVVNDMAFFPNGGYIVIYNGNGYSENNAPSEVLKAVADLRSRRSRCPINVSVGYDGTWLVYFACFRGSP